MSTVARDSPPPCVGPASRTCAADAGVRRLRVEIPFRVRVGAAPRHGAPTASLEPDGAVRAAYHRLAADLLSTILNTTTAAP